MPSHAATWPWSSTVVSIKHAVWCRMKRIDSPLCPCTYRPGRSSRYCGRGSASTFERDSLVDEGEVPRGRSSSERIQATKIGAYNTDK